ncbi:MAG: hypothetical protein OHK006_08880 [Thermodesulfovibrionales bacterium]
MTAKTLAARLLVPVLATVSVVSLLLILAVYQISSDIVEDFHRHLAADHIAEVKRLIDSSLAELTTAQLLDNAVVVDAKKKALVEALSLTWKQRDIGGVIATSGGQVVYSSFPSAVTSRILGLPETGYFRTKENGDSLRGESAVFYAWGWRVAVASKVFPSEKSRREVIFLIPLVILATGSMGAMIFVLLRKNIQQPVDSMVGSVARGEPVESTGIAELDRIGAAVNDAMQRIAQQNEELAAELEERTKAEAAVRQKEEHIRMLLESAAEGIYGTDTNEICTFCNRSCLTMLGYEQADDLIGKNVHELIHHTRPDGSPYPKDQCRILDVRRTGRGTRIDDEVFWRKDGSSFPVEYWSYPIVERGVVTGAIVAFFDITERKKAEQALLNEKNKFEAIIAAMGDGISIQDRSYRVLYQNERHRQFVGTHAGEFCYRAYQQNDDVCQGCPVHLSFEDGQVHTVERVLKRPDGARHFEVTASPLRDASGEIVAGIEMVRDITQRVRTEQQLHQAQKMESIGHLAGGMAHDFNNVLTAILGYASLMDMKIPGDDPLRDYLREITAAVERGMNVTNQILAFSRKQAVTVQDIDINALITGLRGMLNRLIREDITIHLLLAHEPLVVTADTSQLEQVLINLATNARDAMPSGGTLTISTRRIEIDDEFVRTHGYGKPGGYALLSVTDTGIGMDDATRERIFEPFFTTKELGRGTGLGLAMAYGVVQKHNGHITVYSEQGKGSVFRIYLPLAESAKATGGGAPQRPDDQPVQGTETILVAEDDDALRRLSKTVLESAGYTVIDAVDGSEAVAKFSENRDRIAMVLLDGIMPKKNGKEAFIEMLKIRPDLKVVFMSGYAEEIFRAGDIAGLRAGFLAKPVTPHDLLVKIRQTLDS